MARNSSTAAAVAAEDHQRYLRRQGDIVRAAAQAVDADAVAAANRKRWRDEQARMLRQAEQAVNSAGGVLEPVSLEAAVAPDPYEVLDIERDRLALTIERLTEQRQGHEEAIAEIDHDIATASTRRRMLREARNELHRVTGRIPPADQAQEDENGSDGIQ